MLQNALIVNHNNGHKSQQANVYVTIKWNMSITIIQSLTESASTESAQASILTALNVIFT